MVVNVFVFFLSKNGDHRSNDFCANKYIIKVVDKDIATSKKK